MIYGLHDLGGIHNSYVVLLFPEFWWFRGFLMGLVILGIIEILVWFFTFKFFYDFLAKD